MQTITQKVFLLALCVLCLFHYCYNIESLVFQIKSLEVNHFFTMGLPKMQSHRYESSCFFRGHLTSERFGDYRQEQTCLQSLQLKQGSRLSYDSPITLDNLSHYVLMAFSWLFHDFFMTFSWLSLDFLMTFSLYLHDFPMPLRVSQDFSWISSNFLTTFSQLSHNFLMTLSWFSPEMQKHMKSWTMFM